MSTDLVADGEADYKFQVEEWLDILRAAAWRLRVKRSPAEGRAKGGGAQVPYFVAAASLSSLPHTSSCFLLAVGARSLDTDFRNSFGPRDSLFLTLMDKSCPHCHSSLIEIDHYGDRLIGCVECNRWMGDDKVLIQLDETDVHALKGRVRPN